jgi:hypothetical protein
MFVLSQMKEDLIRVDKGIDRKYWRINWVSRKPTSPI